MKNSTSDKGSGKASAGKPASGGDKPAETTTPAKGGTAKGSAAKDGAAKERSETYKLKKEAAEPGTVQMRDTGPGDGSSARADAGKVTPVESSLVGDAKGPPAAEPKDAKAKADSKAEAQTNIPSVAKSEGAKPGEKAAAPDQKKPEEKKYEQKPSPAVVQKTGFWKVVFGGVVAAGIGAGATIWALPHLPAGWLPDEQATVDADAIRADAVAAAKAAVQDLVADNTGNAANDGEIAALQATLDKHANRIDAVEGSLNKLSGQTPAGQDSNTTVSDLSSVVSQLKSQLDKQATQLNDLAARPTVAPDTVAKVEKLASNAQTLQDQISAAAKAAQSQLTAVQAEATKLQESAAETTRRAQAVAAAAALQSALDRGVTAEEAQKTLENVGIDAPEALQKDVPSVDSLQDRFGDASRAALHAVRSSESAEGVNLLTNFLMAQTGARSVAPREGSDPDAILSRANAAVESGDIAAALEEMAQLPDIATSVPAMAQWLAGATAYRDAQKALSDLTAAKN